MRASHTGGLWEAHLKEVLKGLEGSAPGNICTAADAIKAYVQAFLKSKYKLVLDLD